MPPIPSNSSSIPPNGGELLISVESLDHLPTRESPSHVSLQACGQTSLTGPPSSRHKDQNCFKYTTSTNPQATNNTVKIQAKPFKYLYDTSFILKVVYEENPSLNLKATFAMKDLGVNQVNNLCLELTPANESSTNSTSSVTPTIQCKAQLRGTFRREIQYLFRMARSWFQIMDAVERNVYRLVPTNRVTQQLMLVPAIPALLAALLLTPFVAATLLLTLPLAFPVLALFLTTGVGFGLAFFLLYASTSRGRQKVYPLMEPTLDKLLQTKAGQSLLYPIGPRPTPVDAVELLVPESKYSRLILSLGIDAIGSSSYLLPFLGEASDLVWAPLQTILIMAMYNETTPKLKYLSFAEELLPFTDVVPSATIGWVAQYYGPASRTVDIPDDLKLKEN